MDMDIQTVEDRLRAVDAEIWKIGAEYAEALTRRMGIKSLDDRARFLRVLFRRRDGLLEMYAREGGSVKDLYTFEVGIGGTEDGGEDRKDGRGAGGSGL